MCTCIRIPARWWWNVIDVEVLSRAPVIFAPLFLRPIVKPVLVWSRRKIAFNVPSYNLNSVSRWIASSTLSNIRSPRPFHVFAESKKRASTATKSIVEELPRCLRIENNCSANIPCRIVTSPRSDEVNCDPDERLDDRSQSILSTISLGAGSCRKFASRSNRARRWSLGVVVSSLCKQRVARCSVPRKRNEYHRRSEFNYRNGG